ncbi:hypothetical protein EVAR_63948_1 [Eumeta japonica]|uniref:Uncharacterized protein n=1 Tax=Eumeta variegata TaxID=151549 RepID=A0A4C1ZKT3_EUMVA|nr:hypothetical protein EVAR_63948_1 [Eumeta japonica]
MLVEVSPRGTIAASVPGHRGVLALPEDQGGCCSLDRHIDFRACSRIVTSYRFSGRAVFSCYLLRMCSNCRIEQVVGRSLTSEENSHRYQGSRDAQPSYVGLLPSEMPMASLAWPYFGDSVTLRIRSLPQRRRIFLFSLDG